MAAGYSITCLLILGMMCFTPTEGRQMCLSCQYSSLATDSFLPCLDDPWNWKAGNNRQRCLYRCTFEVTQTIETEEVTYASRGCTASDDDVRESGCVETEEQKICYFSCGEGDNYCNNWNATDVLGNSSPQLRPLSPLVAILLAAVGGALGWAVL